jgi:hypothetical protein
MINNELYMFTNMIQYQFLNLWAKSHVSSVHAQKEQFHLLKLHIHVCAYSPTSLYMRLILQVVTPPSNNASLGFS